MIGRGYQAVFLATAATLTACASIMPAAAQERVPIAPWPAQERAAWAPEMGIDDYAWIERADVLGEAIGEAPPDYAFAYGASEPWAWVLEDGSLVVTEQREDGLHSYYFDPDASAPFLVRDPEMSFAFVHGQVAVVYDAEGGVLSRAAGEDWLDQAIDEYDRGRALHRAWRRRDERPVAVDLWIDFGWMFNDWNQRWDEGKRRHHRWRRWRERSDVIEYRRRRNAERRHRDDTAELFRRWREGNWRGTPPGRWQRPSTGWRPGVTRPNWGKPITDAPRPPRRGEPGTRPPRPGDPDGATPRTRWGTGGPMRPRRQPNVEPVPAAPVVAPARPSRPGVTPGPWGRIERPAAPAPVVRSAPPLATTPPPEVRTPPPTPPSRSSAPAPAPRSSPRGTWGKDEAEP